LLCDSAGGDDGYISPVGAAGACIPPAATAATRSAIAPAAATGALANAR
jgi:hypothetical protein